MSVLMVRRQLGASEKSAKRFIVPSFIGKECPTLQLFIRVDRLYLDGGLQYEGKNSRE